MLCFCSQGCARLVCLRPLPDVRYTRSPLSLPKTRHTASAEMQLWECKRELLVSVTPKKTQKAEDICGFHCFFTIMYTRKCYLFPRLGCQSARCYANREKWHPRVYCPQWKTAWCEGELVLMKQYSRYASNSIFKIITPCYGISFQDCALLCTLWQGQFMDGVSLRP